MYSMYVRLSIQAMHKKVENERKLTKKIIKGNTIAHLAAEKGNVAVFKVCFIIIFYYEFGLKQYTQYYQSHLHDSNLHRPHFPTFVFGQNIRRHVLTY